MKSTSAAALGPERDLRGRCTREKKAPFRWKCLLVRQKLCDPADQLQESLGPFGPECPGECPHGLSHGVSYGASSGPYRPRAPECPKSVPRVCRGVVLDTFLTLRRHSRDTSWTVRRAGPEGLRGHPLGHSVGHRRFRGHSRGHSPGHSGAKGPKDPCSWSETKKIRGSFSCESWRAFLILERWNPPASSAVSCHVPPKTTAFLCRRAHDIVAGARPGTSAAHIFGKCSTCRVWGLDLQIRVEASHPPQ